MTFPEQIPAWLSSPGGGGRKAVDQGWVLRLGSWGSPALPCPGLALAVTPASLGCVLPFRLGIRPFPICSPRRLWLQSL